MIPKQKVKGKVFRKAWERGRPKVPHSPKTRIGALGASTTTNGLLCVWSSTQENAKVPIATIFMVAHTALDMDDPACKIMQQRIIEDPPDFLLCHCLPHQHPQHTQLLPQRLIPRSVQLLIISQSAILILYSIANLLWSNMLNAKSFNTSASHSTSQESKPTPHSLVQTKLSPDVFNSNAASSPPKFIPSLQPTQPRTFLDLLAGHSAPLSVAAGAANLDHFIPFDIEYDPTFDILDEKQFENLLQLVRSGVVGAIWSAPPCRLYSTLQKEDGGPPPLRSLHHLDGLPDTTPQQLQQVQESREILRRSSILCTSVFHNREALQAQSNLSIHSLGGNLFINNSFANVPATLFLHPLVTGDSTGSTLRPLQQPQTKSILSQASAPTRTTSTFEEKDSQTAPLSVHFPQNTLLRLQPQSLTSSNLGFPNHQSATRPSLLGDHSSFEHPSLQGLGNYSSA